MKNKVMRFCKLICVLILLFISQIESSRVHAFTGTFGINYGRLADNIPAPDKVVQLLRAAKIRNVRIFDYDHSVLQAFSNTGLELVVGLPNGLVNDGLWGGILGAVKNIYNATKTLHLDKIQVTTSHHFGVFDNSYPPSNCTFRDTMKQYMKPLLEFFSEIGSPFCLNAYPFLTYMSDPTHINISYALFQKNPGIIDSQTKLHYDNLLDAQIDAAYAALEDAGYKKMEVIITETGWASSGDQNEAVATPENARTYNFNLRKRLALRKGTPLRPKIMLKAYLFAMFNEDSKSGPSSERNFGLWKPDGSISYDVGFPALKSSAAAPSPFRINGIRAQGWLTSHSVVYATSMSILFLLLRL
ncbi:hypothetical protein vseg_016439 [Gypsophila vaccaria]